MLLGLDIGTSAVKAVLMDEAGRVAEQGSAPLATQRPRPGWSEQDPETWWAAVRAAVAALPGRDRVRGIGLSGQMHAALCLDAAGNVLRPAILWNDSRAGAEAEALAADPGIAARAGVVPLAGLTAPKLMWLARHERPVHARIATLLSVKDWIGFRLHGGFCTDPSDAAGTLWFDEAARAWSPALARASATDPGWLPPVLDGHAPAGTLVRKAAEELDLPHGLPVVAGAGDTVAGAVGLGVVRPGRGLIGLGTSGQLLVLGDRYAPRAEGMIHAFAFTLPGLWYRMAAMLNGARPLAWFAGIAGRPIGALLQEAAAVAPDRAPLFLPYLTGERTPHGDAAIRGGFLGLADDTDAAAMMRGVVDAVAYSFADAAEALGTLPEAPLVTGGGTASALLLQTLADVLGTPVRRAPGTGHGAALGAARLAAVGVGAMCLDDLTREPERIEVFEPDPATAGHHSERLARFRRFYKSVKGL